MISSEPLLSIGAFAEMTLLSVKALRLYDERALLNPAEIDPHSGYRYYRSDQAPTGRLIALLRAAQMPLREIETVLTASTPGEALALIESFRESQHHAAASHTMVLERARRHFTEDTLQSVTTTIQGDLPVLSALIHPAIEQLDVQLRETLESLASMAKERGLAVTAPGFGIFHGQVSADSSGPLEVCLPVSGLTGPAVELRSYRLAGANLASVTVRGEETDFPAILAAYDQCCAWIASNGFQPAGPPREIWQVLPWDSAETEMTVSWPYLAR